LVKPLKRRLLEEAFATFSRRHLAKKTARADAFHEFTRQEAAWLQDYTLFRVLMEEHGTECWDRWPETQRMPPGARMALAPRQSAPANN
jgi:4-alpha-glucanotransferase